MKILIAIMLLSTSVFAGVNSSLEIKRDEEANLELSQNSYCVDFAMVEIENYLQVRPRASDTLEGIHAWWIRWPSPESIICTDTALHILELQGIVESFQLGSRILWRRPRTTE